MSLTTANGPLTAKDPHPTNFEIDGPKHRIAWDVFPRRVRAELGGATVFDTRQGRLLHESMMLPVLYVPEGDVEMDLLEPTDHSTHCPFKGDASYWSVVGADGEVLADDAVWSYPEPNPETSWLEGHYAFYWDKLDAWYDEDERVHRHLRDPYHRVDVRPSSVEVVVRAGSVELARSTRPMLLSETGIPNRLYIPREDVAIEQLEPADKRTHCPYKGDAGYLTYRDGDRRISDLAWSYEDPFDDARRVGGHVCFDHEAISVAVDPG